MGPQSAASSGTFLLPPSTGRRLDLQFLRASGLAQARLQVAVLSGNRRRALEQIDRLVAIDREIEQLAKGETPRDLEGDLADARLALASEKLALTSEIQMPRLEPAFGAGMSEILELHEEVAIVEEATLRTWLIRLLIWGACLLLLAAGVAAAIFSQF